MKQKVLLFLKNRRILMILWFISLVTVAFLSAVFWGPSFVQFPLAESSGMNYNYPKSPAKFEADKIEDLIKINIFGWKRYHSSLGFSFQYPPELDVEQFVVGDPSTPGFDLNDSKQKTIFLFKKRADGSKETILSFYPAYKLVSPKEQEQLRIEYDKFETTDINDLRQKVIEYDRKRFENGSSDSHIVVWKELLSSDVYIREAEVIKNVPAANMLYNEVWIRTKSGVMLSATGGDYLLNLVASSIISD